jgi:GNAT superfamily N-acetyltransferase
VRAVTPHLRLTDAPEAAAREAILVPLRRYNETQVGPADHHPLVVLVTDPESGAVLGGLWGLTSRRWLKIELLALPDGLRGGGLGTRVMRMAEDEALRRDCLGAWLDTFSFQARGFYEKLGFTVFGEIPDYPPGHSRIFLRKRYDA